MKMRLVELRDDEVVISREEYAELLDDSLFLECLRHNGVDNWEWWDEACASYHQAKIEDV